MSDSRISELNPAAPLLGSEYMPLTQLNEANQQLYTLYTTPDAIKTYVLSAIGDLLVPAGSITTYGGTLSSANNVPGWLLCDGSSVSRSTYSKLFARIGTTYGYNDDNTFKLPNLKGRVIIGYCDTTSSQSFSSVSGGNWPAASQVSIGSIGGEFYHQLSLAEMPAHTHTTSSGSHSHMHEGGGVWRKPDFYAKYGISEVPGSVAGYNFQTNKGSHTVIANSSSASVNVTVNSAGGNMLHNTTQPYVVMNYIIKY